MRCAECGYQNDEGVKVCVKCGTKLSGSAQQEFSPPSAPAAGSGGGNPTIKGNISNQPAWDAGSKPKGGGGQYHTCPDCSHYPLQNKVSAAHPCPNCQFTGTSNQTPAKESSGAKTAKLENVDFGVKDHKVTLTDIRSEDSIEFKGKQIDLKRDKLDPSNDSISSKHAALEFENGQLYIKDKSSNQATFIQVQGKVPISRGSKIIIGNKIYRVDY